MDRSDRLIMFAIPSYGKSFKHAGGRCFINRAVERKAHLHGLMQVSKGNELSNPREAIIAPESGICPASAACRIIRLDIST